MKSGRAEATIKTWTPGVQVDLAAIELRATAAQLAKQKEERKYCQECKEHSNKPSRCKLHGIYTGRKNCCDNFERVRK